MNWPQITYLTINALALGVILAKDGQPQEKYSFFASLTGFSIGQFLLYMGGFYS